MDGFFARLFCFVFKVSREAREREKRKTPSEKGNKDKQKTVKEETPVQLFVKPRRTLGGWMLTEVEREKVGRSEEERRKLHMIIAGTPWDVLLV